MQIIGTSSGIKRVREDVRKLSKGSKNVLVVANLFGIPSGVQNISEE